MIVRQMRLERELNTTRVYIILQRNDTLKKNILRCTRKYEKEKRMEEINLIDSLSVGVFGFQKTTLAISHETRMKAL